MSLMCQRPDRDVPGMKCGYPLPCPHHTLILNPSAGMVSEPLEARITNKVRRRVKGLTAALQEIASVGLAPRHKLKRRKKKQ